MTVWTWRAVVGDDVLAGIRADHVGDAGELADQIGTEVRCALGRDAPAVAVTVAKVHGDERDAGGTGVLAGQRSAGRVGADAPGSIEEG
jgi:hypothetical protein